MKQKYKIHSSILCLFLSGIFLAMNSFGQENKIQVKSAVRNSSGNVIPGAAIYRNEGTVVIYSNDDGTFSLEVSSTEIIRVEAKGYDPQVMKVSQIANGESVVLKESLFRDGASEKMNVPFGTIAKRQFTGAADIIEAQNVLKYDANQDVYTALIGRISGNSFFNARGIGDALVVIDGFPRASSYDETGLTNFDLLRTLNMQEVDQIVLLKDGTSRMLYGVEAGRPVLLITTRRGVPYKRTLQVSAERGINTVRGDLPEYLNAGDYMKYYNKALINDGLSPLYTQSAIDNTISGTDLIQYPDQGYYNSTFLKDLSNFHRVSAETSGGNDKAQYYSDIIWNSQGNFFKLGEGAKDRDNQFSFRGNVDYKLNDWVKVRLDALAQYGSNRVANADFWNIAGTLKPNAFPLLIPIDRVLSANKSILASAKLYDGQYVYGGTDQYRTHNMYAAFNQGGYSTYRSRGAVVGTGVDFDLKKIIQGLNAQLYYSFEALNKYRLNYASTYKVYRPSFVGDSINIGTSYGTDTKATAQAYSEPHLYRGNKFYALLNYSRVFAEKHAIDATMIGYWTKQKEYLIYNAVKRQHAGIRVDYMYDNRLIAEINATYAGSGVLEKSNRYRFSPGINLGWVLTEESFMKDGNLFDYLKVKAGVANIKTDIGYPGYYLYNSLYDKGPGYAYNQASGNVNAGRVFSVVGNPDMGLINRNETNVGFEALLLKKRLSVEANYFSAVSDGMVVRRINSYPSYMGMLPYENFSRNRDNGFEGKAVYSGQSGDFSYSIGGNISYTVPKALKVDEVYDPEAPGLKLTGEPYDRITGYVAEGLFKDDADIASHVTQFGVVLHPGDIKYKDLNGDEKVDGKDQKIIGNERSRLYYGLEVYLGYRNWSFLVLGAGVSGAETIYNSPYYWINSNNVKYSVNARDYWTPENASTAKYPRLSTGANSSNSNNFRRSTFWIEKNNYFNLDRIQLSYNFSVNNRWYKGLEIYLRGSNLMLLSPVKREMLLKESSRPSTSTFAIGCDLKF
jgi:TonB-linked SusC/RagA family outer membrane protein